jgi:hypothetical protein
MSQEFGDAVAGEPTVADKAARSPAARANRTSRSTEPSSFSFNLTINGRKVNP